MLSMLGSMSGLVSGIGTGFTIAGDMANKAFSAVADFFTEYVYDPIVDFFEWIEEGWEDLKGWGSDAWEWVGEKWDEWIATPISDFWTWIEEGWEDLKGWGSDAWDSIGDAWDEYIGGPIDTFFGWIEDAWDSVTDSIETGWNDLTSIFDFEWDDLLPDWSWDDIIPEALSDFLSMDNLSELWDSITGMFDAVMEPIKGAINDYIIDTVNDVTGYELPLIGESLRSLTGLGKIPHLAKGGIVNNPTLAMIGEDGPEAVIPLTQRNNPGGVGMGGGTYNITVNAGGITDRTDKRSLAREIGNMIQQEMARNIGGSTMRGRY